MLGRTPVKKTSGDVMSPQKLDLESDRSVRRSIGEWEAVTVEASTSSTSSAIIGTQAGTARTKASQLITKRTPTNANKTFIKTPPPSPKYADRTAEARACLVTAKLHLKNSKNIKTEIKNEVTKALDRLYRLVKEAEVELGKEAGKETGKSPKTDTNKPEQKQKLSINENSCQQIQIDHSRITKALEEHAKQMAENSLKMEELKAQMQEQSEVIRQMPMATYASVAAAQGPRQGRNTLHSVVVSSSNESETGEAILSRVREAVDAKEGWVTVERVRKAKDRKVIMGFGTKQERDKVKDRLSRRTADLVVEDIRNKDPLLVLKNVLTINSDEDVVRALRNQNKELFRGLGEGDDRIEVKFRKRARNPHQNHVVVGTSPGIWRKAIDLGSLHIDLQRIVVEDQTPLVQCTRCLGYGHGKRFCKEPADACSHCGGPHLRVECADWLAGAQPKCRNCTRQGLENAEHNAFSEECPVRKKWDLLARSAVAYC